VRDSSLAAKPGAWVDLGLTLPIFIAYHLGVIFLDIHNAADVVTFALLRAAAGSKPLYLLFTAAIGVVFAGVFAWLGRGHAFRPAKFVQVLIEGLLYAVVMRISGSYVVAKLVGPACLIAPSIPAAAAAPQPAPVAVPDPFTGLVMSLGAGFYEELAFRVLLFGLGAKLLVWVFAHERVRVVDGRGGMLSVKATIVAVVWGLVAAAVFSGVHYVGPLGDSFHLGSFVFRLVLGAVLTLIYAARGFAAAVWAHALYDVWVLVRL
jgi:hypothetical protein